MESFLFYGFIGLVLFVYARQANKIEDLEIDILILKRAIIEQRDIADMVNDFDMEQAWWQEQPLGLRHEDPDAYRRWKNSLH